MHSGRSSFDGQPRRDSPTDGQHRNGDQSAANQQRFSQELLRAGSRRSSASSENLIFTTLRREQPIAPSRPQHPYREYNQQADAYNEHPVASEHGETLAAPQHGETSAAPQQRIGIDQFYREPAEHETLHEEPPPPYTEHYRPQGVKSKPQGVESRPQGVESRPQGAESRPQGAESPPPPPYEQSTSAAPEHRETSAAQAGQSRRNNLFIGLRRAVADRIAANRIAANREFSRSRPRVGYREESPQPSTRPEWSGQETGIITRESPRSSEEEERRA